MFVRDLVLTATFEDTEVAFPSNRAQMEPYARAILVRALGQARADLLVVEAANVTWFEEGFQVTITAHQMPPT